MYVTRILDLQDHKISLPGKMGPQVNSTITNYFRFFLSFLIA
jgi:hypothetical protein